jgi:DtxR family Mn-dependent transcriptional regulator
MAEELSATLEDYLGVVLRFQREKHFARVSDIAAALGVAKSAVTAALQSLSAKGLVAYKPYEPVTLTDEGAEKAEELVLRHRILHDFLARVLGLEPDRAETISCRMEHAIDAPALQKFVCFLAFVSSRPDREKSWLKEFQRFSRRGTRNRTTRQCIDEYLRNADK